MLDNLDIFLRSLCDAAKLAHCFRNIIESWDDGRDGCESAKGGRFQYRSLRVSLFHQ